MMIFTTGFWESTRGGSVPGMANLKRIEVDLVSEVNEANVSLNRGMSCRSLCNGSDIRELVRVSHNGSSSGESYGCVGRGALMLMSCISVCIRSTFVLLAFSIHSLAACLTSSYICHWVVWVLLRVVIC